MQVLWNRPWHIFWTWTRNTTIDKTNFQVQKNQTKVKRFFNKKGCRRCSGKTWSLWPFPPHFNCVSPFAAIPEGFRYSRSLFLFDIHSWGVRAATQSLIVFEKNDLVSRASLFSRVEALSTKLSQSQIYMTCVYSKLCVFILSGMSVTLWDQLMLDVRSSSLCRWFYEILLTWTVIGKKTCEELCNLHSSSWSAWDGKEYNWYTDRTREWVCRIKICDLPQTRLAVFLLHTSARNTKTPCWNFHCWYTFKFRIPT